jgi:hypothetical protein
MESELRQALLARHCHQSQLDLLLLHVGISTVGQIGWLRKNNTAYWNTLPVVLRGILEQVHTESSSSLSSSTNQ